MICDDRCNALVPEHWDVKEMMGWNSELLGTWRFSASNGRLISAWPSYLIWASYLLWPSYLIWPLHLIWGVAGIADYWRLSLVSEVNATLSGDPRSHKASSHHTLVIWTWHSPELILETLKCDSSCHVSFYQS